MENEERQAVTEEFEAKVAAEEQADEWALVILWSSREPERVGEVALLGNGGSLWILGRCPDAHRVDPSERPVTFFRQRPLGVPGATAPEQGSPFLLGKQLSRRQLEIRPMPGGLQLHNVGVGDLLINRQRVSAGIAPSGATIYLEERLLLYCTRRPRRLPPVRYYPVRCTPDFGEADAFGVAGESPCVWNLRDRAALLAQGQSNVLIMGESGTGKELAAHIIHGLSARSGKPLVATNIAAIAPGLATVQLFGNRKGFPESKMPESRGLVGAADGSSLFLDEIGDMPLEVQPMFLRVTDERREYHRLGDEDRPARRSDFRLIGATNRPEQLRLELKRRFPRSLQIPPIQERREDIPLLVRHLLLQLKARGDREVEQFFSGGQAQVHPLLIEYLVHHRYQTHVAEIATLLGQAMAQSRQGVIEPCSAWVCGSGYGFAGASAAAPFHPPRAAPQEHAEVAGATTLVPPPAAEPAGTDKTGLPEMIRSLLARIKQLSEGEKQTLRALIEDTYQRCRGDHKKTAAQLGLDRYKLYRLLRRVGWQPVRSMSLNGSALQARNTLDKGLDG